MSEEIKAGEETTREIAPYDISFAIASVLAMLDTLKPSDRSKADRHYAVAINDLEHVLAYVDRWIVFGEEVKR